ncbi:Nucleoside triphosphate pyrophosphohydrolase [Paraglaciecola mesophila]|uniref:Nucleoside triphosphate pyrophosphohydrolase n=1 Tax=Paraglaciecola mesophila TaxID=197222 RepID=A0A857JP81_9ALTE|nr:nucleoside triphosphate pyrophosphohydrolase [Paraglaciecola mesophila]QHJ12950.1 Nucleoside triphosphate pyrophosphohydrolase [Paraglaciecola mesophila]
MSRFMPQDKKDSACTSNESALSELLTIMRTLRDPKHGCNWDQQQTFASIVPYTIEEAYEVADAIDTGDMTEIRDELGDLLFQVVFYAQMAEEQKAFAFEDVMRGISAKLRRRHPHIFADESGKVAPAEKGQWEKIKTQEREAAGKSADNSILAHVPKGMSPLIRAQKLQQLCAKSGFDWPELQPVLDKLHEEIEEVMVEVDAPNPEQAAIEDEIGDVLFSVVNLARHVNVDAQTALRKASNKFEQRFRQVERIAQQKGQEVHETSLDELETFWQQAKELSK